MPKIQMPDFKKAAENVAGFAANRAKSLASFTAKKTKNISRIAKLNVDIAAERDTIKSAYSEIGKLYYETHREAPEDFFLQLCLEIDHSLESIADMEREIVRLKTEDLRADIPADAIKSEPDIEVEIVEEDDSAGDA